MPFCCETDKADRDRMALFRSANLQLQAMRGKDNSSAMNISRIDIKGWWWAR